MGVQALSRALYLEAYADNAREDFQPSSSLVGAVGHNKPDNLECSVAKLCTLV